MKAVFELAFYGRVLLFLIENRDRAQGRSKCIGIPILIDKKQDVCDARAANRFAFV